MTFYKQGKRETISARDFFVNTPRDDVDSFDFEGGTNGLKVAMGLNSFNPNGFGR